ncbi:hypothetical protein ANCCAN_12413 [Ancylostoma caninum]|uniref:Uncharacterized protein n=1 Tax=Ancylostoma caninum TaxID=29170 RepID=A0A368GB32_ANCCA|nr:hypothetical protein ANCCAN_12413 [Ancylostoma caninum]
MDCLIVTRSGFVLASSTNRYPGPLARFDPQLFASLEENNLVTITTWVDAQAECMASRAAPWASPAPGRVNPIQSLVNTVATLLGKTFWIDLYYLMTSFVAGQPSMSGGICRFQRIKPVERRHISAEKEAYDRVMAMYPECEFDNPRLDYFVRYARVYPVPGTTLTLIRADRACPGYRSKKKYHVQPQILEGCEKVTYFDKRPPTRYNTSVDPNEEPTPECLVSDSTSAIDLTIIQLLLYILVLNFTT